MSTHKQYAICLQMINKLSSEGSWCGETHIQKSSYIMQTLSRSERIWDFVLYKHGPYSFDLHSTIDELRQMDFIELKIQPPYGPQIRLSNNGEELLQKLNNEIIEFNPHIEKTASLLADKGVQQLEKLSTALLLSQQFSDDVTIAEKLHEVKPHIAINDAIRAVSDFKELATNFSS